MNEFKALTMKIKTRGARFAGFLLVILLLSGGASLWLTGCDRGQGGSAEAKPKQLYTCGMHPQVIQDRPGNCPVCGMKLTPIRNQGGSATAQVGGSKASGERKVKYYKSTMNPGEISPTPKKDSMGNGHGASV